MDPLAQDAYPNPEHCAARILKQQSQCCGFCMGFRIPIFTSRLQRQTDESLPYDPLTPPRLNVDDPYEDR